MFAICYLIFTEYSFNVSMFTNAGPVQIVMYSVNYINIAVYIYV